MSLLLSSSLPSTYFAFFVSIILFSNSITGLLVTCRSPTQKKVNVMRAMTRSLYPSWLALCRWSIFTCWMKKQLKNLLIYCTYWSVFLFFIKFFLFERKEGRKYFLDSSSCSHIVASSCQNVSEHLSLRWDELQTHQVHQALIQDLSLILPFPLFTSTYLELKCCWGSAKIDQERVVLSATEQAYRFNFLPVLQRNCSKGQALECGLGKTLLRSKSTSVSQLKHERTRNSFHSKCVEIYLAKRKSNLR